MASSTTLLYRFLGIDEGAGAQFDKMAAKTAMLGDSSKTALGKVKMLAAGFGLAGTAIGIASIKMASDYQRSMLLIQTQAGASAAEVKKFSKALLDMAPQVGTSPEALANSLYHVYSMGLKSTDALRAVKVAAEGAKIGNANLEETTNALTATIASGIKGSGDFAGSMSVLNRIVGSGDMSLTDLNEALGTGFLMSAKAFGMSIQQAGAMLAVFGDNNVRGAEAGTKLRMVMQDLAKPAANADKVLGNIGLSAKNLRDTLEHNGPAQALVLLSQHMEAAGITGSKVGGFLEDAFTKKAGVGLSGLLTQMIRTHTKLLDMSSAANGLGSAWEATSHTTAFAFDRLRAEAQVAMITLGQHLLPVVTDIATWLGTKLPAAVHVIAPIIRAFATDVGSVLGPAWHVVAVSLGAVVGALGAIGHAAAAVKGPMADLATQVLITYAAFKTVGLAVAIFKGIQTAIILTRVRLLEMSAAFKALAISEGEFGVGSLAAQRNMATLGAGAGATGASMAKLAAGFALFRFAALASVSANADQVNGLKQIVSVYQGATHSTDLSAQAVLRWAATAHTSLGDVDAIQAAMKDLGLTSKELAAGVSGPDAAYKKFIATLRQHHKVSSDDVGILGKLHDAYKNTAAVTSTATGKTKDNAAATLSAAESHRLATSAARSLANQIATLTTNYQNLINTEISQMQTEDGFRTGLLQLAQTVKDNGHSLSQNTLKGLANRDALLALAQSAEKAAEGSKNYKGALIHNIDSLIAFATKAGYSKSQVEALLTQMHLMPKQIKTRLTLDTSGVTQALVNTQGIAAAAGHAAGISYQVAFRAAMKIQSPSKVFRYYGQMLIEGLILGWKDGTAKLKNALPTPVQAALDRMTTIVKNAIKKQSDALKASQTALKDLLKQRAADIANLAGNISGSAGLSNLFGTDANGNPSVTNVNTFLNGQASMIENFAKDLKWGAAHGLAPALLQDIAGLGAAQGDQVLQQFMSGAASIRSANSAESAIQRYSTSAASQVENAVYAKSVAKDRKAVHDNTVELRKLTAALHKIERNTGKAAALHMTIDAKTGRPVVDKKFIDEILKGIRQAERVAGKKLI